LSGNEATDTVPLVIQELAAVVGTCAHVATAQAAAGSSEVDLRPSVRSDSILVRSLCSEDLQHPSPVTHNVTNIYHPLLLYYHFMKLVCLW